MNDKRKKLVDKAYWQFEGLRKGLLGLGEPISTEEAFKQAVSSALNELRVQIISDVNDVL